MNFRTVSALSLLLIIFSHYTCHAYSIHNDLQLLAETDQEFAGFKDARIYIDNTLVQPGNAYTIYKIPANGFTVEIEIPAHFAAQLAGKKLSKFSTNVLSIIRCYVHFTFKPLYPDEQDISLAEVLIFKSSEWQEYIPEITIRPRGIRSVTAYIQDQDRSKTVIY